MTELEVALARAEQAERAVDVGHTKKLVEDGLNGALSRALTASEQATANMLLATIAVAGRAVA